MTEIFHAFDVAGPLTPAPGKHSWPELMKIAIEEAKIGMENGEVPVGALLIDPNGQILTIQTNMVERLYDPAAHAEMLCLRHAGRILHNHRLEGCALVTTLEPCAMCAVACIYAHIEGIDFGAADPARGAIISNADMIDLPKCNQKIWHMGGIESEKCAALLNTFFKKRRNIPGE